MTVKDNSVVESFLHIEVLVENPREAADYMQEVFGAVEVETDFAASVEQGFDCECVHVQAGGVVFQLIKPDDNFKPELEGWWDRGKLKQIGPFIHNVTFFVNDAKTVAKKIIEKGGSEMSKVTVPIPGGTNDVYMCDARKQCGMVFEFAKTPPAV